MTQISEAEYKQLLRSGSVEVTGRSLALERALDIRKFEIQLYWTRAAYFWAFIGAVLAAFGAIQTIEATTARQDLSVFTSCIGLLFSFAWYCANRGSKHWQENWEKHVDLLEDEITGPLYKIVLTRANAVGKRNWLIYLLTGPEAFSVSKINQIVSAYMIVAWLGLLGYSLPPFEWNGSVAWRYVAAVSLSFVAMVMIWRYGKTQRNEQSHIATLRAATLSTPSAGAEGVDL